MNELKNIMFDNFVCISIVPRKNTMAQKWARKN